VSRIFLSPPDVTDVERTALLDAFDGGWIAPVGPDLARFEKAMGTRIGRPGAVALNSGTAALHLALLDAGVVAGDRVFVSTFTFAATANAVRYCGAEPVFIDSEAASWNMSPDLLETALEDAARAGSLPAAVVVVDLYGQCADYDRILPVCQRFDVPVIEDAAEALGASARGRAAGSFGTSAALSFNGNKIITTSSGGMLLTASTATAARARHLATQARQPVVHYEHDEVGFNYRMSNLLAALGLAQLGRLDEIVDRKRRVNAAYRELLTHGDVTFMPIPDWSEWNAWLTCVVFDGASRRDRVMKALAARDIESRPLWKPMHLQPVFTGAVAHVDGTSDALFDRGLCLPSGGRLTQTELECIAAIVTSA
jgi:dTDP-4-amino-4,6-dideoxygalactose transaminase